MNSSEQSWKCGICGEILFQWLERLKHIAKHWEQGLSMSDWKADDVSGTADAVNESVEEKDYNEKGSIGMPKQALKSVLSIQGLWKSFKGVLY